MSAQDLLVVWAWGLLAMLGVAVLTWGASIVRRDVSLVDRVWSVFFVCAALTYAVCLPASDRSVWVLALLAAWAARLAIYITARNWGHGEDRRYQAIRARNQPHFAFKSLYLVFVLQALIASVISTSLLAALAGPRPVSWLDGVGAGLVLFGLVFETLADAQMSAFKRQQHPPGTVMDSGLWRWSRHPNYFGEACVWWGFWLIALSAGGGWTVFSPIIMTLLLLKVSGVALLEKDLAERKPAYQDYVARTSAFFPCWPRQKN